MPGNPQDTTNTPAEPEQEALIEMRELFELMRRHLIGAERSRVALERMLEKLPKNTPTEPSA